MRWFGVALAILLAGCVQEAPVGPETDEIVDPLALAPVLVPSESITGAEPSLAFDADGWAYLASVGGGFNFWRLAPGEDTFEQMDVSHMMDRTGGGDTDVVVADGAIYTTDLSGVLATGYTVGKSTDRGETWRWTYLVGQIPPLDRPWLVTDGQQLLGMAYNAPPTGIYYLVTLDDGETFPLHVPVRPVDPDTEYAFLGHPAVAADGDIAIPYYVSALSQIADVVDDQGFALTEVGVALSSDGGLTWRHVLLPRDDALRTGIWSVENVAWTHDDRMILAWSEISDPDGAGPAAQTYVVALDEARTAFDTPIEITGANETGLMPWVVTHPTGGVALAYYGADEAVLPWDVQGNWTARAAFVDMASGTVKRIELSPEPVKEGVLCGGGNACRGAEDERALLDFLGAAFAPDGRFAAAWSSFDSSGGENYGHPRFAMTAQPIDAATLFAP